MIYHPESGTPMEGVMWLVLILSLIVCAYMAWNIGANDVANAMGTSVGSKALTLKQAVIIAAVFEFCGAFFAGDAVTDTVRKGILVVDFETVIFYCFGRGRGVPGQYLCLHSRILPFLTFNSDLTQCRGS